MGQYLIDQVDKPQRDEMKESVNAFVKCQVHSSVTAQRADYIAVLSLYTLSWAEWETVRPTLLKREIYRWFNFRTESASLEGSSPSAEQAFNRCRPAFIFIGIVNYFQDKLKPKST